MHCLQHTPPSPPASSSAFRAHSLLACRCPLNCWHFSSAVWTNSCAIKRIDYTTNKSRSETKAEWNSKAARSSVDPCPRCPEIRAALIWARQTLNEAKFVLLVRKAQSQRNVRCLLSGARINQKTLDWPPLIARRERLLRCRTQSCCQ